MDGEEEKLPKDVLRHLEPSEQVLFRIRKKMSLEKPKWLIVTDSRIIYLDEKVFGRYDLKAIPYQKLERVTVKLGIMSSEFIIEGEENITLKLGWMNKEEARKAINAIKDALNSIAIEPVSIGVNKGITSETWILKKPKEFITRTMPAHQNTTGREKDNDPMEQLKKLKELYDMGIINQEEYEGKRKKLLEKI
ncbi:PH domain-containing protein [Thermococcus sp.]|uniref:PH domain-containing protein n=1 Tax=Thermococcus sp. TaxID=35749 RepID=UPI00261BA77F|nr:PH domain-containing protein [Thermococcus sp.]